jgi:CubicO group peptidase (beta-lactamase class C family)
VVTSGRASAVVHSVLLSAALTACGDSAGPRDPLAPSGPIDLSAEWVTGSPASQGIDPAALSSAIQFGAGTIPGLTSVLLARNGRLVAERYFRPGGADSLYALRSVTKSVVAILLGLAIDRGFVDGTGQRLSELFAPPLPVLDADHGAITVADLLTMRSGIDWDESSVAEYNGWALAPDQIEYLLARAVVEPGSRFNYNSAAVHLLSAVLQARAGGAEAFADDALLEPLGIRSREWELDNRGIPNGGAGLYLRPRDMAKIGQLVLQRGHSAGVALIPEAWLEAATTRQLSTGTGLAGLGTLDYGYLWWVGRVGGREVALAWGHGGQYVYVVPALELVVVTTATWQGLGTGAGQQMAAIADLISNRIVPSVAVSGS